MRFTECIKASDSNVSFSPNGRFLANACHFQLLIYENLKFNAVIICRCADFISEIRWSPDSCFVMCILRKRSCIQIWSTTSTEWNCLIDEGSAGLLDSCWAADSRHILSTCDLHLRITVWSLSKTCVSYMKYPKACSKNLAFSPGGRYLCLLERKDLKDYMSLFDCQSDWLLIKNVELDTKDATCVEWSPDGRYIAVQDSCLYNKVAVYSSDGRHLHSYSAAAAGEIEGASTFCLGVKNIKWSQSGQLLVIGGYDQKCRLLHHANWSCLVQLKHPVGKPIDPLLGLSPTGEVFESNDLSEKKKITPTHPHRVAIYLEESTNNNYKVVSKPIPVPSIKPDSKKPNPKIGVGLCLFSPTGRYLATRNDNAAGTIWIWIIGVRISLVAILIHTSGQVQSIAWDPQSQARLALCIGTNNVFMWTPQGCLSVKVAHLHDFPVKTLSWNISGEILLLQSAHEEFCLCYLDSDEDLSATPSQPEEALWKAPSTKPGRCLPSDSEDYETPYKKTDEERSFAGDLPCWAGGDGIPYYQSDQSKPPVAASSSRLEWKRSSSPSAAS